MSDTSARGASLALLCGVAAVVVALDQASKAWVRATLAPGGSMTLVPGVMDLRLVYNTGAAFSLGEGSGWLFVLIAAIVSVAGAWVAWNRAELPRHLVALMGCVVGGGIGNAIDRLAFGRVTDFLATTFMDFAVFNVADVFITCGIILGMLLWLRWDRSQGEGDAAR